jgi:predicted SnoaL-like aldol condensation-catalyzing enzyme
MRNHNLRYRNMTAEIKNIAREFLLLCANGNSRDAFKQHTGKGFKHHNAYFKGDGEILMLAMEESARQNPHTVLEIQRILQDGDLVGIHSFVRHTPEESGYAIMHIYRFEENKIMEMWDFGQAVPPDMPNENGMF